MTHIIELELTDGEVHLLREIMDKQPIGRYSTVILKTLKALPLDGPTVDSHDFTLVPLTDRGKAALPYINKLLDVICLPHGDEGI